MQIRRHFQATLAGQVVLLLAVINSAEIAYAATGSPPRGSDSEWTTPNELGFRVAKNHQKTPLPPTPPSPTQTHYRFTTIDVPGSVFTSPVKLNNDGLVSGSFNDGAGNTHGFLWDNGTIMVLDAPGATSTFANGNNDRGVVAGGYIVSAVRHAALYSVHHQTWTQLPDIAGMPNTGAVEINNKGICLGSSGGADWANCVGWIWDGKSYSFFSAPGASAAAWAGTAPQGINELGQAIGTWVDDLGANHGFLKDGPTITTFDIPGVDGTVPCSINNEGDIAGYYYFNDGEAYGFILHKGRFVTVGYPNSTLSGMSSINDRGELSGIYQDSSGNWHGFVAMPKP
jgi:probable HAF family extracellular repeat protein